LENFKAGVIERLGFGYEAVRAVKPDIIYCSVSGYGQQGPMAGKAAYDGAIQAVSGMMGITGTPESGPMRAGYMPADISTGITAAFAISSALFRRTHTGEGQYLDVSMLDSAMTIMSPNLNKFLATGQEPELVGNTSPTFQGTANTWPTKDGYMQVSVITDKMTATLVGLLDHPEWADDARFATSQGRVEHNDAVKALIGEVLLSNSTAHWIEHLGERGIPVAPVNSLTQLMEFPQLAHRGILATVPAPPGVEGEITMTGAGFHASNGEPKVTSAGPRLSQHTDEVLGELGYDAAAIQALRDDDVI